MAPHFVETQTGRVIGHSHKTNDSRATWMHNRAEDHAKVTGKEVHEVEDELGTPCSELPTKYPTK